MDIRTGPGLLTFTGSRAEIAQARRAYRSNSLVTSIDAPVATAGGKFRICVHIRTETTS